MKMAAVTDEDDCSARDGSLFNPNADLGPLNTRCAFHEELLYPISRYREAFLALHGGDIDSVLVAVIAGVPTDDTWSPGDSIEDLRDLVQTDDLNPLSLRPSCSSDRGTASPPVRLVELAYSFEENGVLASICEADWTATFQAISDEIQRLLAAR